MPYWRRFSRQESRPNLTSLASGTARSWEFFTGAPKDRSFSLVALVQEDFVARFGSIHFRLRFYLTLLLLISLLSIRTPPLYAQTPAMSPFSPGYNTNWHPDPRLTDAYA